MIAFTTTKTLIGHATVIIMFKLLLTEIIPTMIVWISDVGFITVNIGFTCLVHVNERRNAILRLELIAWACLPPIFSNLGRSMQFRP